MKRFILSLLLAAALFSTGCRGSKKSTGYSIGIDPHWYPLVAPSQEKNILAFSIDLLVAIAKYEGLELSVTNMSWNNLLWGLKEQKYDAALSSMRPYLFYLKEFTFSKPYLYTGPVLVTPENSSIKGEYDLMGKEIAVVSGSSAALLLQSRPGVMLQSYSTIPEVLEAVADSQVDLAAVDVLIAQKFVRDLYRGILKIVGAPLSDEGLRLITLFHRTPQLIDGFDKGLEALKKNGTYDELLTKWGLSPDGSQIADLGREAEDFLKQYL